MSVRSGSSLRFVVGGVSAVLVALGGYSLWVFGAEQLWWGQSAQVKRLWAEQIVADVESAFPLADVERVSPETGFGMKPVPASIGLRFVDEESAEGVLAFLESGSDMGQWQSLGTCPEKFAFCATKSNDVGETLILTYELTGAQNVSERKAEGILTVSVQ